MYVILNIHKTSSVINLYVFSSLDESAVERSRRVSNFVIIYFDWAYAELPTSMASSSLANVVLKLVSDEYLK